MRAKKISYKEIPYGNGCLYIFRIWKGGIYGCYRHLMYAYGSNTSIYNHRVYSNESGRHIIIQHKRAGKMTIKLDGLLDGIATKRMSITRAAEDTGISERTLAATRDKISNLKHIYKSAPKLKNKAIKKKENKGKAGRRARLKRST